MLQRALVLALACLAGAGQQTPTGSIRGKATDERAGVLPGMVVTVAGPTQSKPVTTTTSGLYEVPNLPPGTYAVRGALPGFQIEGCAAVVVRDGEIAECNLTGCVWLVTCADRAPVTPPSPEAIDRFTKEALLSLVISRSIPDMNLLRVPTHVPIRDSVGRMGAPTKLGPDAIPQIAAYRFYLASIDDLTAEVDRAGGSVAFLTIDGIRITGASGSIIVGVDIVSPRSMKNVGKLCCCIAEFEFTLTNGHWAFVKRGNEVCS